MTQKIVIACVLLSCAAGLVTFCLTTRPVREESSATELSIGSSDAPPPSVALPRVDLKQPVQGNQARPRSRAANGASLAEDKTERLARVHETFRALALGDPKVALQAAKQLEDENEKEAALMELVTVWRRGEIDPPRVRASRILEYGLEAAVGMELAKDSELALNWADELTNGPGRSALVQQIAAGMVERDPSAAFSLSERLAPEERRDFLNAVYAEWAQKDTDAALEWANQVTDPAEQEGALQAIRSVAPVGIGTEMMMQEGYPVIRRLIPGMPAELTGQIQPGDKILAIAQGDSPFMDAHELSLAKVVEMIRGAPGTAVQLQVVASDASPGSSPRTVSVVRGQIKYKK